MSIRSRHLHLLSVILSPMSFKISKHAKTEIHRRGLSMPQIEAILAAPEQVVVAKDGLQCYQSRFGNDRGESYLLRIIVNGSKEPKVVVTAYQTSKVSKYWEELK